MMNCIFFAYFKAASHVAHIIEFGSRSAFADYGGPIIGGLLVLLAFPLGPVIFCLVHEDVCKERKRVCRNWFCGLLVCPCSSCKCRNRRSRRRRWSETTRHISPPSTAHTLFPEPTEEDAEQLDFVSMRVYIQGKRALKKRHLYVCDSSRTILGHHRSVSYPTFRSSVDVLDSINLQSLL